jgi:phosphoenolpyruvate synthase/pyruvate phosphate dikinase
MLLVNTGETVAFTEQKNFYQVAVKLSENSKIKKLFVAGNTKSIVAELKKYSEYNSIIEKHIQKYEWINTEYVSGGWSREKWMGLFQKALTDNVPPKKKLEEILNNFEELNKKRRDAINELKPTKEVLHSLDALAEFISQRDWTKGYFTRALLSYNKLIDEIGKRIKVSRSDIFSYSYLELDRALQTDKAMPVKEIASRKKDGFAIVIKGGKFELVTGKNKINKVINNEGIFEPFKKMVNIHEFRGLSASAGFIRAKARVLEDASMIGELQKGEILVTYMTTIEFIPAFRKAAAVVTDEGGVSCHAAIISREFKLPCIVGTKIATRVVQTGDLIEVDANRGIVKIMDS